MSKKMIALVFANSILLMATAQINKNWPENDTGFSKNLPDVTVVGRNSKSDYQAIPEIVGTNIYAAKKSALIVMNNVQGNVSLNNMRQVLAKVPGIHIWESDPSGIQIGVAARGLSPNRSFEFNVRQNGYDISADPFGYPEAYYNPQLQAVQRIEIIRGQGSLQYGPQFGGLINYIIRNGSEMNKTLELESQQTVGTNGLWNAFLGVGGKKGKIHYYTFFDHRNGNGWRANSQYFTNSAFGTITFQFNAKLSLTAELMYAAMRSQQPGGLTDLQIQADAQQSVRSRNWFGITWKTPALVLNYVFNEKTRWNTKFFGTIGDRNSVGFLQSITIKDSIQSTTKEYANRVVNLDQYRNFGIESRILTEYTMGKMRNHFSGGIRLYTGNTFRQADGKGTTGTNYELIVLDKFPRDISFQSQNLAIFAENIFRINQRFSIIPGIRYEWLKGASSGQNGLNTAGSPILLQNIERSRSFFLIGLGSEFELTKSSRLYANIAQAYRPIQFANLQAPPTTDVVDEDLKDAKGYNIDLGYRGKLQQFFQFDFSLFFLKYNNRIGTIVQNGTQHRLITNVGASSSKGLEGYLEFNPIRAFTTKKDVDLFVFGSYGYTNALYDDNHKDANTKGKKVENAPQQILRAGITAGYKKCLITTQYSYVSDCYSDANNTLAPSDNGNLGKIPAYSVTDITLSYRFNKSINLKSGVNNLFNTIYFTRRAGGYPGPGAMPADGRTGFLSLGVKI